MKVLIVNSIYSFFGAIILQLETLSQTADNTTILNATARFFNSREEPQEILQSSLSP